jgi:hypothetical protein
VQMVKQDGARGETIRFSQSHRAHRQSHFAPRHGARGATLLSYQFQATERIGLKTINGNRRAFALVSVKSPISQLARAASGNALPMARALTAMTEQWSSVPDRFFDASTRGRTGARYEIEVRSFACADAGQAQAA